MARKEETRSNEVRGVLEEAGHAGLLGMGRTWLLIPCGGEVLAHVG